MWDLFFHKIQNSESQDVSPHDENVFIAAALFGTGLCVLIIMAFFAYQ